MLYPRHPSLRAVFFGAGLVALAALAACTTPTNPQFGNSGASGGSKATTGGSGGTKMSACENPADCDGEDSTCQTRTCVDNTCGTENAALGTACDEDGGSVCDDEGTCVECNESTDCASGVCDANTCVPANCTDAVKNGDESDVDCGGSCTPCVNDKGCGQASDCKSGYCDEATMLCAACSDHAHCAAEQWCDPAVDGGSCAPDKMVGDGCGDAAECTGNANCIDSFCCDTACDGGCEACASTKNGGKDGECGPVASGTDPDDECANGACNGSGDCGFDDGQGCMMGTECLSSFCADSVCCDKACGDACDACSIAAGSSTDGVCEVVAKSSAGNPSCSPYLCDGSSNGCPNSCVDATDCAPNSLCVLNQCIATPISCSVLKMLIAAAPDGPYTIDPDGMGGNPSIEVYCDMTNGGITYEKLGFGHHNKTYSGYALVTLAQLQATVSQDAFIYLFNAQMGMVNLDPGFQSDNCCIKIADHVNKDEFLTMGGPGNAVYPATTVQQCNPSNGYTEMLYGFSVQGNGPGVQTSSLPANFLTSHPVGTTSQCSNGKNPGWFFKSYP